MADKTDRKVKLVGMVQTTNHICYITKKHNMFLSKLAKKNNTSKLTFVEQLMGKRLRSKEEIDKARTHVISLGYKTIGEWLEKRLDEIKEDGSWENAYQK